MHQSTHQSNPQAPVSEFAAPACFAGGGHNEAAGATKSGEVSDVMGKSGILMRGLLFIMTTPLPLDRRNEKVCHRRLNPFVSVRRQMYCVPLLPGGGLHDAKCHLAIALSCASLFNP